MKRPRDTGCAGLGTGVPTADMLPATVAHELNNIVASLRGFLELARDAADAPAAGRRAFNEISLGVERVAELAADVAAFAGSAGPVQVVPLEECAGVTDAWGRDVPAIRWDLDRTTRVLADPDAARRAVATLNRLAGDGGVPGLTCHGVHSAAPARCAACAADCGAASAWFTLPLTPDRTGFTAEPAAARRCLTSRELRFEALSRLAHDAGGHLVVRNSPDFVSLVLPLA